MAPVPPVQRKTALRDDIQGVRALGALLVFVFHVYLNGVSGGVDVFFVVSAYFMARNALKSKSVGGQVDILAFYKGFLLRVAPQAAIALIGIAALVYWFSSPMSWAMNFRSIGVSALYLENWWLISRGQDYLARSESLSLTQHFWAMSLIGQSYLVWPLLVSATNAVSRRLAANPLTMLTRLLVALSVLSFCWSVYATSATPARAYFDFFTRFWEFGAGALLGLLGAQDRKAGTRSAALFSWIGAGLLLSCGFLIGSRLNFPGFAALWPVSAAMLIIQYGQPSGRFNAGRVLSHPLLVRLGGYSYGIYLWHWPLYALYEDTAYRSQGNHLVAGLIILLASIGLAVMSKKLADALLRLLHFPERKNMPALGVLGLLMLVGVSTDMARRNISENGVMWDQHRLGEAGFVAPGPFRIRSDNAVVYKSKCHQDIVSPKVNKCEFGERDGRTIVLIGGSHSAQWLPALTQHAGAENWKIISITKSGCLFADPADQALFGDLDRSCAQWNADAMRQVIELKPDLVLSIATRWRDEGGRRIEYIPAGYQGRFRQLSAAGIPVVAIRDNPWMQKDPPRCVYSPIVFDKTRCGDERDRVLDDAGFQRALLGIPPKVRIVDMTDYFCDSKYCWAVKDGIAVYRDPHHITATYAQKISPVLRDHINAAWPERQAGNPTRGSLGLRHATASAGQAR
ncbi:acyltransferase family protein [Massilia sp. MS-15]|uniref:acyltransferase family protein n=1 Tax=Massilia sp. MS-15 TaxID=2878200 RepID=UPI001CD1FD0A|nr:acyltransferase family protein [Massilia sp. MS-15]MCA1245470.1 acyltransferase [Massilia sp. MS-15]